MALASLDMRTLALGLLGSDWSHLHEQEAMEWGDLPKVVEQPHLAHTNQSGSHHSGSDLTTSWSDPLGKNLAIISQKP